MRLRRFAGHELLGVLNIQVVDATCALCEESGVKELDAWGQELYTQGQHPLSMYQLRREGRNATDGRGWYPDKVKYSPEFDLFCNRGFSRVSKFVLF